jgi:hypothetical protein
MNKESTVNKDNGNKNFHKAIGKNTSDIYSVIASDPGTDRIYENYNLSFTQADKVFDTLRNSNKYQVILLNEGDISIRGYGPHWGEEREDRYEVLTKQEKLNENKEKASHNDIPVQNSYTFYEDSGHGWLEVPVQELQDLGIQERITAFSYLYKGKVYLEEDRDAGTFLDIRNNLPKKAEIHNCYFNGMCFIREYPHYDPGDIQSVKDNPVRKNTRTKDIGWER